MIQYKDKSKHNRPDMNDSTAKYHRFEDDGITIEDNGDNDTKTLLSNIIPFKHAKFSIESLIDLDKVKRDIFLIRL